MKLKKFNNGFKVDFSTKHRIEFIANWVGYWETKPQPLIRLRIYDKNVKSLKPHNKYHDINNFSTLQETFNFLQEKCKTNLKQKIKDELLLLEKQILDKNSGIVNISNNILINTNN